MLSAHPFFEFDADKHSLISRLGAIEGDMVELPDGTIADILRHSAEKTVMLTLDKNNPYGQLRFDGLCDFEATYTKFHIVKYCGKYYAAGNPSPYRNTLVLYDSYDAVHWRKNRTLIDLSDYPAKLVGVQYPSFFIEADTVYLALRTAFNGADDFHNNNCITFHKCIL